VDRYGILLFPSSTDLKNDAAAKLGSDGGGFDPTTGSIVLSREIIKWHLNVGTSACSASAATVRF